ncbi:MAG: hypothetical protein ACYCZK_04335 [Microbacteriaceae bacterium]
MRTTVDLDESMLVIAKAIARDEGSSLGAVLSRLARRGLEQGDGAVSTSTGFPVFVVGDGARPITLELVNEYRDGD